MKWAALESQMLSAAAYDDSKQVLYLRPRNTGTSIASSSSRPPLTRASSVVETF